MWIAQDETRRLNLKKDQNVNRVELCTDCPDLRSLWFTQLQYRPLIWFYANSSNSSVEHSRLFKTECIIATKLFHKQLDVHPFELQSLQKLNSRHYFEYFIPFLYHLDGVKRKNYTPGVKIAFYPIDFTLKTKNHGVFFFYPIETFFLWGKILKF